MEDQPSRFDIIRYAVGDLSESRAREVSHVLSADVDARRRLQALRQNIQCYERDSQRYLSALMARIAAEPQVHTNAAGDATSIESAPKRRAPRLARPPRRALKLLLPVLVAAALAALVLPWAPRGRRSTVAVGGGAPGFKGSFGLRIVAKRGSRQFVVRDGMALVQDDALRFIVTSDRPGYVTVLSFDGRRQLSCFYPDRSADSEADLIVLDSPGRHVLPGSVILDDALGRELLIVVFSPKPFRRRLLESRLRARLDQRPIEACRTSANASTTNNECEQELGVAELIPDAKVTVISIRKVSPDKAAADD